MNADEIREAMAADAEKIGLSVGTVIIELVRIPAGEFDMGSAGEEEGHSMTEEPLRHVKILKAFYLGRYPVTQAQYKAVMGDNPSKFEGDTLPVEQVTYSQAIEFCRKLSELVGVRITLPTEAQCEYACRAGTKTRFYSGETEEDLAAVGWYKGNSKDTTHEVGQKEPNAWGLYDMHGNVWELCLDCLPPYDRISPIDPVGTIHERKGMMRGGGWLSDSEYCRAACRFKSNDRFGITGLRVAIVPEVQAETEQTE